MGDSYLPQTSSGALLNRSTVEFTYKSQDLVKIAGDFNSWQLQEMEKVSSEGCCSWRLSMDLPLGQYQYRYQVAGAWVLDQEAGTTLGKEGVTNNIIMVSNDVD